MSKRRVKTPGRFMEELRWYVVQFHSDNELSAPISGDDIEDKESGETGYDKVFHLNEECRAVWKDGEQYEGKIIYESDKKESCQKFVFDKKKEDKSVSGQSKKVTQKRKKTIKEPDSGLEKKKKEQNAKKKEQEKAVKETAIQNAQRLFKEHDTNTYVNNSHSSNPVSMNPTIPSPSGSMRHTAPASAGISTLPTPALSPASMVSSGSTFPASMSHSRNPVMMSMTPAVPSLQGSMTTLLNTSSSCFSAGMLPTSNNVSVSNMNQSADKQNVGDCADFNFSFTGRPHLSDITESNRTNVTPLSNNTNWTPLSNTTLAPLSNNPNLTPFSNSTLTPLSNNTNLAPLSNRTNITDLTPLPSRPVSVTPLSNNTNLAPLSNRTNITDLTPLPSRPVSVTPLSNNTNWTPLSNHTLAPLSNNPNLTPFSNSTLTPLSNNTNLAPLSNRTNITDLTPLRSRPVSVTPLSNNTNWTPLSNHTLAPLSNNPNLAPFSNSTLTPLSNNTNLAPLSNRTNITDLTPLPNRAVSVQDFVQTTNNALTTTNNTQTASCTPSSTDESTPLLLPLYSQTTFPPQISTLPSLSERPLSFMNGCGECVLKEAKTESLSEFCSQLQRDVKYWQLAAENLRKELELVKASNTSNEHAEGESDAGKLLPNDDGHYYPARSVRVSKSNYIMVTDSNIPPGYTPLVEGHPIYVTVSWLQEMQGTFKGKTKSCAFKLMINGFFRPDEVSNLTGSKVVETPLGRAIKAYAMTKFDMSAKMVNLCLNSKIGTMNRAAKKLNFLSNV